MSFFALFIITWPFAGMAIVLHHFMTQYRQVTWGLLIFAMFFAAMGGWIIALCLVLDYVMSMSFWQFLDKPVFKQKDD